MLAYYVNELRAKGWSQVELSEITGRPPRVISEIVNAKRRITPATAVLLGAAFNKPPMFWLQLETQWQLASFYARRAREKDYAALAAQRGKT